VRRLLLAVAALVCAAVAVGTASAGTIRIGKQANGKSVRLTVGDLLEVRLASNPSTGSSWEVAAVALPVLRIAELAYKAPPQTDPPTLGRPGTEILTFRARSRGRTVLRLEYVGPGRAHRIYDRFAVTVVVG
jgi:predicted secreted protein